MKTLFSILAILIAITFTLPAYAGDGPPGESDVNRLIRMKKEQEAKLRDYLKSVGSAQDEAMKKLRRDNARLRNFRIIKGGKSLFGSFMDFMGGIITCGPNGMQTPGQIGINGGIGPYGGY